MIAALALLACAEVATSSAAPVTVAYADGGLGAPRSARFESALSVRGAGSILADLDNFYGHLRARALVGASYARGDLMLGAELELLRAEEVIQSLSASRVGLGSTSLTVGLRVLDGDDAIVALSARVALPTDFGARAHGAPLGADLGALLSAPLHPQLELHAHALFLGSAQLGDGPTFGRAGLALGGGASWQALSWLSLTGDLGAQLFYDDVLDRVTVALALRAPLGDRARIELELSKPLFGEDRTLALAGLGVLIAL